MTQLSKKIKDILDNSRLGAMIDSYDYDRGDGAWYNPDYETDVNHIRAALEDLRKIARHETKPDYADTVMIVSRLERNLSELERKLPFRGNRTIIKGLSFNEIKRTRRESGDESLVVALNSAISTSISSFYIHVKYPFAGRKHANPVNTNALLGTDGTVRCNPRNGGRAYEGYQELVERNLTGDALKTAILELMYKQLQRATPDNLEAVQNDIINSPAYAILTTSQSRLGTMHFFKGKTSSQEVLETMFTERAQELQNSSENHQSRDTTPLIQR